MALHLFFFELKLDCLRGLDHELMNRNTELYFSLDPTILTLPSQHLLQFLHLSTLLQLIFDLLDAQLIRIGQSIPLSSVSKHIRLQIMYIIPLYSYLDLILLLYDPRIAIGVSIDALNGGRGDLCDLLREFREEVAFSDVLFGDLVFCVEAAKVFEGEFDAAYVSAMGF